MKIFVPLLVSLLSGCAALPHKDARPVTISQLRSAPENSANTLVRVSGIWFMDFETSILVIKDTEEHDWIYMETKDQSCRSETNYLKFERDRKRIVKDQLARSPDWDIRAKVEVEGYFEIAPPPKTYTEGNEQIVLASGYGHFSTSPYQIRLTRIVRYEFLQ